MDPILKRRAFLGTAAAGTAQFLACGNSGAPSKQASAPRTAGGRLAGMDLVELRRYYRDELFNNYLPFWDKHGVDHEYGGIMHSLDYDGTLVNPNKFHWFQGRGVWVYSFLYNYFGKDARHLEIARKTKDFMLKHFPQPDGWWAESVSREGKVLRPFQGDVYGMYFAAEGLQEFAFAAQDEEARAAAFDLLKRLHRHISRKDFRSEGTGDPGVRPQGAWMVNLRTATQMLRRWKDPEIQAIAEEAVDAVIHKHYNPEIGLNNENLNFDFSRPRGEEMKCIAGHSVETLWMIMDEADRRNDPKLWNLCAERIRHHLDVGWDHVFGGLVQWVNVDHPTYEWPAERPVGTTMDFRFTGEYQYLKALWAVNEVLVAALNVYERTGAEWAARYFEMAHEVMRDKFFLRQRGYPGYILFADRRITFQPHTSRQDNYHPPRQFMLTLMTLDRMIERGAASAS